MPLFFTFSDEHLGQAISWQHINKDDACPSLFSSQQHLRDTGKNFPSEVKINNPVSSSILQSRNMSLRLESFLWRVA
jgi:hypothetical protein